MTVYTQVSRNRTKTWFFLLLYMALLLAVARVISWYFGSPAIFAIAAIVVIVQGITSYWFSDKVALAAAAARPLDKVQYGHVYTLTENLCITAGLPMPKLYAIDDTALNAFATGRDAKHAAIALTTGIMATLNDNELEGVIAHELSHIGNEDIRLMSMVMIMGGLIALISDWFLRSMFWGGGDRDSDSRNNAILLLIAIALAILAPIASTLIQLAISRRREFMADANAVLLTRYPEGMISALRKIGGDTEPLEVANKATAHMYFSNPLKNGGIAKLFSTHPSIEDRIKAIQQGSGAQI